MNRRVNKNGLAVGVAQLEDLTGGIEVLFFPQAYAVYGMDVVEDAVVLVKARVSVRDDRISLIANDLAVPDLSADRGRDNRCRCRCRLGCAPPTRSGR